MAYTLTYSEQVEGWPSFYSYYPDWMVGMNNYFYTFKGGNLYQHNSNTVNRNTFYGIYSDSTMKTVLNDVPLENKLFKTIDIQGDDVWEFRGYSDLLQNQAYVEADWFEKKEQTYFAYIRSTAFADPNANPFIASEQRSVNGIGSSISIAPPAPNIIQINFSISPLVDIGTVLSIGDFIYFNTLNMIYCGKVVGITRDYPNGDNYILVNTAVPGGNIPPTGTEYFFFIKGLNLSSINFFWFLAKILIF